VDELGELTALPDLLDELRGRRVGRGKGRMGGRRVRGKKEMGGLPPMFEVR